MNTNMKKYENPMLQIVSIKQNDIIATSGEIEATIKEGTTGSYFAPGRYFDDYDAGY